MKLKDSFLTHELNGEQIMMSVDGSFDGLVTNNETAAFIVNCLKEETTEEEIAARMYEQYDAPIELIRDDVKKVIEKLRCIGAIE